MTTTITIITPDDFHHHLRDESECDEGRGLLSLTCKFACRQFQRVIVMPNLKPPIRTTDEAYEYKQKILKCTSQYDESFEPLMTLYLTDNTT